jgi:hypothetical protein
MTQEESQKLQKDGANARAIGRSIIDNPFYKPENMPGQTGEEVAEWQLKVDAWELGWRIQDLMDNR